MHLSGDLSVSPPPLPFPHSRQVLFVAFLIVVVVIFRRRQQYRAQALQSLLAQGDGTDGAGPDMQALRGVVPVPAPRRPAIRHGNTEVAGSSTDTAERSGGEPAGGARAALPVRVESGREEGKRRSRRSSRGKGWAHPCAPAAAVLRCLHVHACCPCSRNDYKRCPVLDSGTCRRRGRGGASHIGSLVKLANTALARARCPRRTVTLVYDSYLACVRVFR